MTYVKLLDCTLRDGGYYNSWDFDIAIIQEYLKAMDKLNVDYVELGLRGFNKDGFKGACAYTTDSFINNLEVPEGLKLGVMVNASDLIRHPKGVEVALTELFVHAEESPISLVRIACHFHEYEYTLPASIWLKNHGYTVGINIMQIADRSVEEIRSLTFMANEYPIDVLYFADSLGSLNPEKTSRIIQTMRDCWNGSLGIHTHDNMGFALANSLRSVEEGVTWIDGTVTGMGRGPGNAKTEYLAIELKDIRQVSYNMTPLLRLIEKYFKPMQQDCGWGTNTFYYLAGKFGIHPTYIQEMIRDPRYNEEDILAVIEYLKSEGGKKFNINTLEAARNFFSGQPTGSWNPASVISNKEVLIIGTGPSVFKYKLAIEEYIRNNSPFVIAVNKSYKEKEILDFGLSVQEDTFIFESNYCILPNSLVFGYSLAIATSGKAARILLAGFDGYGANDSRTNEVNTLLNNFTQLPNTPSVLSITPTQYNISTSSVYAF